MKTSRYKELGPLHDLLLEACPGERKSIVELANRLDITHQYIYRWIENGRVPAPWAKKIADLGLVKIERFYPFVFC